MRSESNGTNAQNIESSMEPNFKIVSVKFDEGANGIALVCRLKDRGEFKLYIQIKNTDMSNFLNLWISVDGSTGHPILNILTHKWGRIRQVVVVD